MRQSLVTKKNRKVRRLRELRPDIDVRLLYRSDVLQLLAAHGLATEEPERPDGSILGEVLFDREAIAARVRQLGREISISYRGKPLILVGLMKGMTFFLADLARAIEIPATFDFVSLSPYDPASNRGNAARFAKDLDLAIAGKDVILVMDAVNAGLTCNFVLERLRRRNPASIAVCALLDKNERRVVDVPTDYVGFEISGVYAVGYGLAYRDEFRTLPYICSLERDVYERHARALKVLSPD